MAFGTLSNGTSANANAVTINFTGANGYLESFSSLALSGLTGEGTTLNPTTTSVTITGNVTNQLTSFTGHFDTLTLDGTSSGNFINGIISNSSGYTSVNNGDTRVTKQNSSTWTLAGNNTYSGPTAVSAGTLILSGNNSAATGGISIGASGTLQLQGNSGNTSAGVSSVMATQNMTIAQLPSGATIQLCADSSIASGGAVAFDSAATAFGVDSNNNRLNGALNFDVNQLTTGSTSTTLQFGSTSAVWQVGNTSNATTTFNVTGGAGYTLQLGSFKVGNNNSLVFNTTTANMVVAALTNGSTGGVTKNGAGTLTLAGANTYTGGTTINSGVVRINSAASLGASTGAATIKTGATLEALNAITTSRNFLISGSATIQADSGVYEIDGTVSNGASSGTLIKTGAGTLTLTAVNGYTGGTTINSGVVQINSAASLGATSGAATINPGATLEALNAITTSRNFLISGSATVQADSGVYEIDGTVGDGASSGTLVKTGAGTLTLTAANTYTGATTVGAGGTLRVTGSIASAALTTVNGTLTGIGTVSGPVSVSGGGQINGASDATLTLGSLSLSSGSVSNFNLSTTGVNNTNALVAVTGALVGPGTVGGHVINFTGDAALGTYDLYSFTGTAPSASDFVKGTLPPEPYRYTISVDAVHNQIDLIVGTFTGSADWNVNSSGGWSTTAKWSPARVSQRPDANGHVRQRRQRPESADHPASQRPHRHRGRRRDGRRVVLHQHQRHAVRARQRRQRRPWHYAR